MTIYTNNKLVDGFGSQYQKIIQTYVLCRMRNMDFVYRPLSNMEHNYDNDDNYLDRMENLMNIKNNVPNLKEETDVETLNHMWVIKEFEKNMVAYTNNQHIEFIKKCFWENKERNFFKNNKFNIAIHIRRENSHDKGLAGPRVTTKNNFYLLIMKHIRESFKEKELLFHIYSQGDKNNFKEFESSDTIMHIDEEIEESFIALVAADILVISPSSFSYAAGLISDGIVFYKPFWHLPKKNWIVVKEQIEKKS